LAGDLINVNLELRQLRQYPARFFEAVFQSVSRLAMIAIGIQGFLRQDFVSFFCLLSL